MTSENRTTIPHVGCKTPGECRKEQICLDTWHCVAATVAVLSARYGHMTVPQMWEEIERLRAELEAAKADIAMLIQKETEACNAES